MSQAADLRIMNYEANYCYRLSTSCIRSGSNLQLPVTFVTGYTVATVMIILKVTGSPITICIYP